VDELRYVIEVLRQKEAEEQLPVIKLEIDYELVTLHDALLADDKVEIIKAKERLEKLRTQWLKVIEQ
jgi:(p)ppGpp synthase/HD superfamily hydrolase